MTKKINSNFVEVFGDTPVNRLWDFLVDSRGLFDYSMTDICEAADVSWNTLKEIFPSFIKEGIIKETRKIGRATMYILNETHPKAVFMIGLHKAINMIITRGGKLEVKVEIIRKDNSKPVKIDMHRSAIKPITG